jgi:hypothetical protein
MLFMAAIIETFVTRYTSIGDAIRFLLILTMFALVIFYVVIYPKWVFKRSSNVDEEHHYLPAEKPFLPMLDEVKNASELFGTTFSTYFKIVGKLLFWVIPAALALTL